MAFWVNLFERSDMIEKDVKQREMELEDRIKRLEEMEREIRKREKLLKDKEKSKKQVLLRLSPSLWEELAKWAEDDFRSINGQIEYLLSDAVKKHRK